MRRLLVILSSLLIACGGARRSPGPSPEAAGSGMTASDLAPRAVLSRGELTTEVDTKRYRAAGPVLSEFLPTDPAIYLVGKLKQVPADAVIEVQWCRRDNPVPLVSNAVRGSSTYQFIASFTPPEGRFKPGAYIARVFVNSREVGARTFAVLEDAVSRVGPTVTGAALSEKVTEKMLAINPTTAFKKNTPKLFLSFDVGGTEPGMWAKVKWFREGELFHEQKVELNGNERYAIHIMASGGLPAGAYDVDVLINDELKSQTAFTIAAGALGPSIDSLLLGTELDADNMPARPLTLFTSDTPVIYCGLRFLDLPANSTLVLHWIQVQTAEIGDAGAEAVLFTSRSVVPDGGSGVLRANWQPFDLVPGRYKVAVMLGDALLAESPFEVVGEAAPEVGAAGLYLR